MKYYEQNKELNIFQCEEIWIRNGIRVNPRKKHKKHGGHISIDSEIGIGTSVTIHLPATRKIVCEESKAFLASLKGTGRILLMDDEASIREATGDLLSVLGYEVDTARDGAEAVERYRSSLDSGRPFDAVILDLTVPGGMGGREAMKRLLKIDPNVTAIVSSGYSHDPIMADHKDYGFQGVIPKPYNAETLSKVLSQVIDDTNCA